MEQLGMFFCYRLQWEKVALKNVERRKSCRVLAFLFITYIALHKVTL